MTTGLFDDLPEQPVPTTGGGGRPRLRTAERGQVELRAVSLDDLVPADHRVRLVWRFVEGLDLSALLAEIRAVEGRPGDLLPDAPPVMRRVQMPRRVNEPSARPGRASRTTAGQRRRSPQRRNRGPRPRMRKPGS